MRARSCHRRSAGGMTSRSGTGRSARSRRAADGVEIMSDENVEIMSDENMVPYAGARAFIGATTGAVEVLLGRTGDPMPATRHAAIRAVTDVALGEARSRASDRRGTRKSRPEKRTMASCPVIQQPPPPPI